MSKLIIGISGASGVVYGIRMLKTLFVLVGYAIGWFVPKYLEFNVRQRKAACFEIGAVASNLPEISR
ncbi:MAG: hypothetical protein A4E62_00184 [Syntrophorhabdus sp. PtaU1.Bin002]|nr:MAG: hypothetical protein A4E62_00184 [Syntrophorhabdus sp. PtaU1.Bin002]